MGSRTGRSRCAAGLAIRAGPVCRAPGAADREACPQLGCSLIFLRRCQGHTGVRRLTVASDRRPTPPACRGSTAASAGPGHGCEFILRLPIAHEEEAAEPIENTDEDEQQKSWSRRRILVVDDNRDAAGSLAVLLRMMGNEVRTAHNGRTALDVTAAFVPDLALLDIGMPGMNGYELAKRLRERPKLRGTVLVALTGWGQGKDRRRSREAGFDKHMTKPADPGALEKLLAEIAGGGPAERFPSQAMSGGGAE